MSKIENKTVIAATASKSVVTLYFDDGTDLPMAPNEQFTLDVVEKITPALARGEKILLNMEARKINIFTEMEKKSGGLVKFFRVAKKALGLSGDNPTETHIESIALPMEDYDFKNHDETVVAVVHEATNVFSAEPENGPEAQVAPAAIAAEAGKPAVPATAGAASGAKPTSTGADTVPAPATNNDASVRTAPAPTATKPAGKVIVGAEALRNQIKHFSEQENPVGFNAFMARISKVVDERRHTVSELLTFLDKADLPIADDGSIVAYKRLKSDGAEYMVDSHSGKVKQKVGSRVFMKPEMVDPNRNNQCSNGLHIGRRDYMGSFSGDTVIICKIAPEDVIAVPADYSGAKMRCSGYHIVHRLNAQAMQAVCSGQKMTGDEETALMLTRILRGDHIGVIETTEITQSYGGGLIITPVGKKNEAKVIPLSQETMDKIAEPVKPTHALEQVDTMEAPINPELNSPKAIKDSVKKAKALPLKPKEVAEAEATGDPRKVKKAKRKAAEKAPEPVKGNVPNKATQAAIKDSRAGKVVRGDPLEEMTEHQKTAKARWHEVAEGKISKVKLAQACKTSTRSLDRWAEKFNF